MILHEFLDARSSPFIWQIVCDLAFHSAAFERGERAELLLGQMPRMGVNFRLAGGAKGASSRRTAKVKLVLPFRTVDRSFGVTLQPFV